MVSSPCVDFIPRVLRGDLQIQRERLKEPRPVESEATAVFVCNPTKRLVRRVSATSHGDLWLSSRGHFSTIARKATGRTRREP